MFTVRCVARGARAVLCVAHPPPLHPPREPARCATLWLVLLWTLGVASAWQPRTPPCLPATRARSRPARCGAANANSDDEPPPGLDVSAFDISRELSKYDSSGMRLRTSGPVRRGVDAVTRVFGGATSAAGFYQRAVAALPMHVATSLLMLLAFGAQSYAPQAAMVGGARVNMLIDRGQWHRLVSPVFLHGGFMHLFSNLFSLWRVGPLVTASFGAGRAWLLYLGSGVAGSLAGLAWGAARGMSVGASGAVFGMMGATGGYVFRNKRALGSYGDALLTNVGQILLLNLFIGTRRGSGIDNLAHVGGFVGGLLLGVLVAPAAGRRPVDAAEGDGALLPPWCVRGLLAATVALYAVGLGEATRIAMSLVRRYGRLGLGR